MGSHGRFPLVERYLGIRMGVDFTALEPGRLTIAESPRRLRPPAIAGRGYVRALWWLWLEDGRAVASVPPGAGEDVRRILEGRPSGEMIHDEQIAGALSRAANSRLRWAGVEEVDSVRRDVCFACNSSLLKRHRHGDCRRLTDESAPPAEGLKLPSHCFPRGIVYGVVVAGLVVSNAFAHRPGVMEGRVADLGVTTAEGHRRRGYAQTVVSAVVEHVTRRGGEAYYVCAPDNDASMATARSVGFVPFGRGLVLSAPRPA